jgi:hypothetical protein
LGRGDSKTSFLVDSEIGQDIEGRIYPMKVVNEVSGNMRQVNSISPELIVRIREALVRSLIWAFIGTLYGLLFALFLARLCLRPTRREAAPIDHRST